MTISMVFEHDRHDFSRQIQQALNIGVNHGVPVVRVPFLDFLQPQSAAGVIDQNIYITPDSRQIADHGVHHVTVPHIQYHRQGIRAMAFIQLFRQIRQLVDTSGA